MIKTEEVITTSRVKVNIPSISKHLRIFLQDWLNWAEGKESITNYRRDVGLCISIMRYRQQVHSRLRLPLAEELDRLLSITCNDPSYPFGRGNYITASETGTIHQDKTRLEWVKSALNGTLKAWALPLEIQNEQYLYSEY